MLVVITLLAFATVFIALYLMLKAVVPVKTPVDMRLKALDNLISNRSDIEQELARPFRQRILVPFSGRLAAAVAKFTPSSIKVMAASRLTMAGGFGGLAAEEFLLICAALGTALPALSAAAALTLKLPATKVIALSLLSGIFGLIFPWLLLSRKISKRKLSIQKDLPDVLDLLTVSVEAGLSFDGALFKLTEKMRGALVDEFSRLLQEIRMGISRREALIAMGSRCDVADLSLFTSSLIQADQLGVSIGNVLRVQSVSMREKRQQRAEEKAMKAPIKMMLPLVLFIFPTIFIVLLGPAIIKIMETLMNR